MGETCKSEAELQSRCVIAWKNAHPDISGRLWATFNEGQGVGKKLAMGMAAGVSDLLYFDGTSLVGIEMKMKGTYHNRLHLIKQARWLMSVPTRGYFVDSEEMFARVMDGGEGISPEHVLAVCERSKAKSIKWI